MISLHTPSRSLPTDHLNQIILYEIETIGFWLARFFYREDVFEDGQNTMVFCSQCGTKLPEEGQFCPKCGSELPRSGYSARPSSESANITATLLHADKNARIIEVVLPVLTGYKCELCKHNIPNYSKCVEYSAIAYGMLPAKKHQHIECWNNGGYLLI